MKITILPPPGAPPEAVIEDARAKWREAAEFVCEAGKALGDLPSAMTPAQLMVAADVMFQLLEDPLIQAHLPDWIVVEP